MRYARRFTSLRLVWAVTLGAMLGSVDSSASQDREGQLRVTSRLRIFPESEPVVLMLEWEGGKAPPGTLTLLRREPAGNRDLGTRAPEWDGGIGKLALGILSRGYYELAGAVGESKTALPFMVTFDPARRPGVDGDKVRVGVDTALPGAVRAEDMETVVRALALCGVAWARGRVDWSEIQRTADRFELPSHLEATLHAAARDGLRFVAAFQGVPPWARGEGDDRAYAADLGEAYRFGRELARRAEGRIRAYEVWNEADLPRFSSETADRYAAFLKAVSLGIRAGDGAALVLPAAFALRSEAFGECLFDNEVGPYIDAYNHHVYRRAKEQDQVLKWHRQLAARFGIAALPNWITEAGIPLVDAGGRLCDEDRWKQAEFLVKSSALSLADGVGRHFFFMFPYFKEGTANFGLLDADLGPTPGAAALATLTYAIGAGVPLGAGLPGVDGVRALFFDAGPWKTAVLWRDRGSGPILLRTSDRNAAAFTLTGQDCPLRIGGGRAQVEVGSTPVFVTAKDLAPAVPLPRTQSPPPVRVPDLMPVVLRIGLARERAVFDRHLYGLKPATQEPVEVEVWNFWDTVLRGTLRLEVDTPFRIDSPSHTIEVEPMGVARVRVALRVPANGRQRIARMTARVTDAAEKSSAAARVRLAFDAASLVYPTALPFPLKPQAWSTDASAGGKVRLSAGSRGELHVEMEFANVAERWGSVARVFPSPRDLSLYDTARVRIRATRVPEGAVLRLQIVEPGGAHYITHDGIVPKEGETLDWMAPFSSLEHGAFSAADPDGRLDSSKISKVLISAHPKGASKIALEILSFEVLSSKDAVAKP